MKPLKYLFEKTFIIDDNFFSNYTWCCFYKDNPQLTKNFIFNELSFNNIKSVIDSMPLHVFLKLQNELDIEIRDDNNKNHIFYHMINILKYQYKYYELMDDVYVIYKEKELEFIKEYRRIYV